ncbi:hypothetical protein LTR10_020043 [Elasticomyces elasticus]|uniref:Uncharacterized protein n=1 Tax=Exophiala sideris TaxID=1016849 RepID=A0ABR0JNY3_9EURO|nr:hypothetical protein LTR10_020043 [Elasticomyces elasticus]KAK5037870.1 hypothetical protein LTS07_001337 [Exophiala sideris]KAK5043853.1 hypothetical protein LTR13_000207 [Exophiala sideris]KAK5067352.1 hypothetical protein LTR69_001339 [Exophiala sideris]KAK5182685.1 hypothetical protein LTR44_005076 [Eurotiomycetes sp. CCFEE 6388]
MKGSSLLAAATLWAVALSKSNRPAPHRLQARDVDPTELYPGHNISVPIDHFHNETKYAPHTNASFNLRYFFDASHYKPGGPVIVLQSGEDDATDRLPYLQKGIVAQLANATNGIGVVLEHRYYGTSFPTANLTTESLRFLTTEQALADQAYFAQHVVFPGLEHMNLTAPNVPYIVYGGSYAGGFAAFTRKLYPNLYFGAISSSGVTEAVYDYWQYYEPIREYGPPACIAAQTKLINVIDNILMKNDSATVQQLKTGFGLETLTYNDDFANIVSSGIGGWQNRNWDPAVNSPEFSYYCGNISSTQVLWPGYSTMASTASSLIEAGGWGNETATLTNSLLNMMAFTNDSYGVASCDGPLDSCYDNHNASATMYTDKSLDNFNALSWAYQYCTEWGYLQTGSGVPETELPLISRLLTLQYESLVCRLAFNITSPPDVQAINKYGGYNISYPRLAFIGGEADPWRPVTPLATLSVPDQLNRTSNASEPVILIAGAVHHWDENGLFPNETTSTLPPAPVAQAQMQEAQIVKEWLTQWK